MQNNKKKQSSANPNDVITPRTQTTLVQLYDQQEKIISVFHTWSPKHIKKASKTIEFWKEVLFSMPETDNVEFRKEILEVGFILNEFSKVMKDISTKDILDLISDGRQIANNIIKENQQFVTTGKEVARA